MHIGQVALRALQFLFTLIITALVGNVIASAFAGNPASINYAIFVAAFSWVVLLFGAAAAFVASLAIPIVLIVLDVIATILTFIAGVVLAAKLGVHSCSNKVSLSENALHNISRYADRVQRATHLPTASPTALTIPTSAAASFKQALRSSGSCSPHTLQVWLWPWLVVVHHLSEVESEEVGHRWLKSELYTMVSSPPCFWLIGNEWFVFVAFNLKIETYANSFPKVAQHFMMRLSTTTRMNLVTRKERSDEDVNLGYQ